MTDSERSHDEIRDFEDDLFWSTDELHQERSWKTYLKNYEGNDPLFLKMKRMFEKNDARGQHNI